MPRGIIDYTQYCCLLSKKNDKKLKHKENIYSMRCLNLFKELLNTLDNPQKAIFFHVLTEIEKQITLPKINFFLVQLMS